MDDNNAEKIRAYLEEVLRRHSAMRDAVPQMTRILETATWESGALRYLYTSLPGLAKEADAGIGITFQMIRTTFPMPPDYGKASSPGATATSSTSAGVGVFEAMVSARDPQQHNPELEKYLEAYKELQEQQNRIGEVEQRLGSLFPALLGRFRLAHRQYRLAIAVDDEAARQDCANAVRNCVWGLAGELQAKAKTHAKENELSWDRIAERLVKDAARADVFRSEGERQSALVNILSNVVKGRPSVYTLGDAWTRFIDHVYIVTASLA